MYILITFQKKTVFLIKYCISYVYSPAIETSQHVSVPLTVTVTLTSYTVCYSVTYCENVVHRQVCTLGIPSVFSHQSHVLTSFDKKDVNLIFYLKIIKSIHLVTNQESSIFRKKYFLYFILSKYTNCAKYQHLSKQI